MAESLGRRMRRLRGAERQAALRDVVTRWRSSGKSRAAFCREAGIATVTLARWLRRLEGRKAVERGLVLVEVGRREGPVRDAYEVTLSSGTRVRVPGDFRREDLVRLLGVLSTAC